MKTCIKCSVKLYRNRNWYESSYNKKYYICKKCTKKESRKKYIKSSEEVLKQEKIRYEKKKANGYYEYGNRGWASGILGAYKCSDKKRGVKACNMSIDYFLELIKNPCSYCGDDEDKIGLDRIDNTKGHTKDNVVPCCHLCNTARMASFSHSEMKLLGKTIAKIKKQRRM